MAPVRALADRGPLPTRAVARAKEEMTETLTLTDVDGFLCRDGTVDANAVYTIANDEYRLWGRDLSGWAIDVGAHIGTVALTLTRQNPGLRVLAVEAVPENGDLIEKNCERIRGGDRVTLVRAWAAGPNALTGTCHYGYRHRVEEGDGYVSAHRFVGNTWVDLAEPEFSVEMPAVSLDGLMAEYGIDDLALLKIDCEGCEWAFLDTPAVSKVALIVGEHHGGYPTRPGYQADPQARVLELLSPTHVVTFWDPDETVVGLFEAVRR